MRWSECDWSISVLLDVYLSGAQLREYLIGLILHRLIIFDSAMRRYHITEKGTRILELWSKLDDLTMEEKVQFLATE
jgi:predicted transcriptional regulator